MSEIHGIITKLKPSYNQKGRLLCADSPVCAGQSPFLVFGEQMDTQMLVLREKIFLRSRLRKVAMSQILKLEIVLIAERHDQNCKVNLMSAPSIILHVDMKFYLSAFTGKIICICWAKKTGL